MNSRILAIRDLGNFAATIHQDLTRGEEILRMNYLPSYEPLPNLPGQFELPLDQPPDRSSLSLDDLQTGFRKKLLDQRSEDINRGVTTVGPHRDELRFLSNGIDLGNFGSRGQLRTALLALKLAEVSWLKEKNGDWPVLLLDEVLAELDDTRRQDLLDRLAETEQSLLTTTDINLFSKSFQQKSTVWELRNGNFIT
jgi:DNA replication and repair protein RecF